MTKKMKAVNRYVDQYLFAETAAREANEARKAFVNSLWNLKDALDKLDSLRRELPDSMVEFFEGEALHIKDVLEKEGFVAAIKELRSNTDLDPGLTEAKMRVDCVRLMYNELPSIVFPKELRS